MALRGLCSDIFIHFHQLHLDRILSLGGRWKEEKKWRKDGWQEAESGGGRHIKEEKFLWKLRGDEEEGKSPSNRGASFASNSPSTETGWNEIPYTKLGSNCASGREWMCVFACFYAGAWTVWNWVILYRKVTAAPCLCITFSVMIFHFLPLWGKLQIFFTYLGEKKWFNLLKILHIMY